MSWSGIRERMRPGEPWMTISFPVCCFSFETSVAISPLSTCELFHSSFLRVLVATCLGMLLNRSANPSGSLRPGHEAAKPSYVTRPKRSASEEKVSSRLNFPISSFQYGKDHFSGDSTTPSNETKRVAANRDMVLLYSWQARSLAHCLLHERGDPCLFGGSQLRQRKGVRPHEAFVEVRFVAEAERRVPRLELLAGLEEADDLVVLGVGGHSVPESRRKGWHAFFDDSVDPLAHGAIRFPHLRDLREHEVFPVLLVRLQVFNAVSNRGSLLVCESLGLLGDRSGLLRALLCGSHGI